MNARPVLRDAFRLFSRRGARFLAAGVAFYALLSAAPLLVVVLHVVGLLAGRGRAEAALWSGLATWVAPEQLETVRALTERLDHLESDAGVLGVVVLVYGSTRLFRALHRALNTLWGVDLEAVDAGRSRLRKYGGRYGTALALAGLVVLLVGSLVVVKSAFAFVGTFGARPPPLLLWALDLGVSVALAFALFVALFRALPERPVTMREAATSAGVSTALFAVGSLAVTAWLRHKHMADVYAGAGAVVLAVVWVYYSAQVFFLGACVGVVLTRRTDEPSS
jgi:membrane protein